LNEYVKAGALTLAIFLGIVGFLMLFTVDGFGQVFLVVLFSGLVLGIIVCTYLEILAEIRKRKR
jgi:hypothetical protein